MKRGIFTLSGLALLTILATSGIKKVNYPQGVTGYSSRGCTCHQGTKGSVTLTGLAAQVKAGQTYTIALVYNQGSNCKYWGLDLLANSGTLTVGTNTLCSVQSTNEISHKNQISSTGTTYTYSGFSWKAPTTLGAATFNFATLGSSSTGGAGYYATGTFSTSVVSGLPVEFASVNAIWAGSNNVNLVWKTATETNTSYFEVERSFDNQLFIPVGKIVATGNSNSLKTYSFSDKVVGSTIAYYRVKEVDNNGAATLSEINSVNVKPVKHFIKNIYPNPVISGQALNVDYVALENGKVNIELYNAFGKKMNSLTADAVSGENNIKFNMGRFVSPGIYYIVVNDGVERIAELPVSVQ